IVVRSQRRVEEFAHLARRFPVLVEPVLAHEGPEPVMVDALERVARWWQVGYRHGHEPHCRRLLLQLPTDGKHPLKNLVMGWQEIKRHADGLLDPVPWNRAALVGPLHRPVWRDHDLGVLGRFGVEPAAGVAEEPPY